MLLLLALCCDCYDISFLLCVLSLYGLFSVVVVVVFNRGSIECMLLRLLSVIAAAAAAAAARLVGALIQIQARWPLVMLVLLLRRLRRFGPSFSLTRS